MANETAHTNRLDFPLVGYQGQTFSLFKGWKDCCISPPAIPFGIRGICATRPDLPHIPFDWESASWPIELSVEACLQWLDRSINGLRIIDHCYRDDPEWYTGFAGKPSLNSVQGSSDVRDAHRLLDALRAKGLYIELTEPPGEHTAHDAVIELRRVRDALEAAQNSEEQNLDVHPQAIKASDDTLPLNPKAYLQSWPEILGALGLENNETNKGRLQRANEKFDGPIQVPGGRGSQPFVEKTKLIQWHNGLEDRYEELAQRETDRKATVAKQHEYGRDGTVVPDIQGSVKKKRGRK